jgi:hypothetical protein
MQPTTSLYLLVGGRLSPISNWMPSIINNLIFSAPLLLLFLLYFGLQEASTQGMMKRAWDLDSFLPSNYKGRIWTWNKKNKLRGDWLSYKFFKICNVIKVPPHNNFATTENVSQWLIISQVKFWKLLVGF